MSITMEELENPGDKATVSTCPVDSAKSNGSLLLQ